MGPRAHLDNLKKREKNEKSIVVHINNKNNLELGH